MERHSRSGKTLGLVIGLSLFVLAPLTVGAVHTGFPGSGGVKPPVVTNKFPIQWCIKSIGPSWLNLKVALPCEKPTPPPPPVDMCPNVPGNQTSTPCADDVCEDQGGTWDGDSCELPPIDECPNVPGTQTSTPCADEQCEDQGGNWGGDSCEFPPVDVCPNVPGDQATGPCADEVCEDNGGIWDGDSCEEPAPVDVCPNVPGDQASGPCADEICEDQGGTWDGDSCVLPPPPEGKLLITEVMYDLGPGQGSEPSNEWVEIYNGTNAQIDLTGYSIADNTGADILPGTILLPADTYLVIIATGSSTSTLDFWNIPETAMVVTIPNATIGGSGGLANGNDAVLLLDTASSTADAVGWGTNTQAFTPAVLADDTITPGHSIARLDDEVDTNTAIDWAEQETPNPGQ